MERGKIDVIIKNKSFLFVLYSKWQKFGQNPVEEEKKMLDIYTEKKIILTKFRIFLYKSSGIPSGKLEI